MSKKLLGICIMVIICYSSTFAANIVRRGNLIIDLDTGKITIANDNAEYQSLLDNDTSSTSTGSNTTGTVIPNATSAMTGSNNTTNNDNASEEELTTKPSSELESAILRGYTNNLTVFNTVEWFNWDLAITREQAAKFFNQGSSVLWYQGSSTDCNFSDIATANEWLKTSIIESCQIGLMKWSNGIFRPTATLTHAEWITVISKIAWFTPETIINKNARWSPYLSFTKSLGILNNTDINETSMEYKISRWDLMLLLYRLSKISTNRPQTTNSQSSSTVSLWAGISDDPEFTTALLWMNKAGMTKYWKASDYNPIATLTRGQAAQFLTVYDQKFDNNNTSYDNCTFNDIENSNFKTSIQYVCEKWILRWWNKLFRPEEAILKAEFIAWLLNMANEYPTTSGWNWMNNVFKKALSVDIVAKADESTFDKPITRYEVALILSKLYLKDQFTRSLSDSTTSYNIISPIENDQTIYTSWQQKVFIDVNSLDSRDFTNWFVTLFWVNYKLSKKQTIQYFPTSYVWYGELSDISDDNVVGTISMSIWQKWISKLLIEWYIMLNTESGYYTIESTDQVPYYVITKVK